MGWSNVINVLSGGPAEHLKRKRGKCPRRKTCLGNGRHPNMAEEINFGSFDPADLEPSIEYLTQEGFIEWYFDKDGELCLRLSEAAMDMDF